MSCKQEAQARSGDEFVQRALTKCIVRTHQSTVDTMKLGMVEVQETVDTLGLRQIEICSPLTSDVSAFRASEMISVKITSGNTGLPERTIQSNNPFMNDINRKTSVPMDRKNGRWNGEITHYIVCAYLFELQYPSRTQNGPRDPEPAPVDGIQTMMAPKEIEAVRNTVLKHFRATLKTKGNKAETIMDRFGTSKDISNASVQSETIATMTNPAMMLALSTMAVALAGLAPNEDLIGKGLKLLAELFKLYTADAAVTKGVGEATARFTGMGLNVPSSDASSVVDITFARLMFVFITLFAGFDGLSYMMKSLNISALFWNIITTAENVHTSVTAAEALAGRSRADAVQRLGGTATQPITISSGTGNKSALKAAEAEVDSQVNDEDRNVFDTIYKLLYITCAATGSLPTHVDTLKAKTKDLMDSFQQAERTKSVLAVVNIKNLPEKTLNRQLAWEVAACCFRNFDMDDENSQYTQLASQFGLSILRDVMGTQKLKDVKRLGNIAATVGQKRLRADAHGGGASIPKAARTGASYATDSDSD